MKNLSIKQCAWRVVIVLLMLGHTFYRATLLFETQSWWLAGARILFDLIAVGFITESMFTHRFTPRSLPYYLSYMKGKDSALVAAFKYVGLFSAMLFGISGFIYALTKDDPDTRFIDILIPTSLIVAMVAIIAAVAGYIKCCVVKENE